MIQQCLERVPLSPAQGMSEVASAADVALIANGSTSASPSLLIRLPCTCMPPNKYQSKSCIQHLSSNQDLVEHLVDSLSLLAATQLKSWVSGNRGTWQRLAKPAAKSGCTAASIICATAMSRCVGPSSRRCTFRGMLPAAENRST